MLHEPNVHVLVHLFIFVIYYNYTGACAIHVYVHVHVFCKCSSIILFLVEKVPEMKEIFHSLDVWHKASKLSKTLTEV